MHFLRNLNFETRTRMYNIATFFCAICVLFATALNIAFTLMPNTMVQFVKALMA